MKLETYRRTRRPWHPGMTSLLSLATAIWASPAAATVPEFVVPVRWCGVREAPTMTDPDLSRAASERKQDAQAASNHAGDGRVLDTTSVLKYRSGNPGIYDSYTRGNTAIAFRASIPHFTQERGRMSRSFPIIYTSNWDEKSGEDFGLWSTRECRQAWQRGDALYYDHDNKGFVNEGDIKLQYQGKGFPLQKVGDPSSCVPNVGARLKRLVPSVAQPGVRYGFVDLNRNRRYDQWEPIYRYEQAQNEVGGAPRQVREKDILLFPVAHPGPGLPRDFEAKSEEYSYDPRHMFDEKGEALYLVPFESVAEDSEAAKIKYVDLFLEPRDEFSIGFGQIGFSGTYAVSTSDYESIPSDGAQCRADGQEPRGTHQRRPAIGQAFYSRKITNTFGSELDVDIDLKVDKATAACAPHSIVVDDHAWIVESEALERFESALVGHEMAHSLGIPHGDGLNNDSEGGVDDADEDFCSNVAQSPQDKAPCITSLDDEISVHDGEIPKGPFKRVTCFVSKPEGAGPSEFSSNLMQYCWNFTQDEKYKKTRDGKDENFQGHLSFHAKQFDAMTRYISMCGFGVDYGYANQPQALSDALTADDSRAVYRMDDWGDHWPGLKWLDIGEFGYDLVQEPGAKGQTVKFGVTFDQNRSKENEAFAVLFGVNADGKKSTGAPFAEVKMEPRASQDFEGADLFILVEVNPERALAVKFWQRFGAGFEQIGLKGVEGKFEPVEVPSGIQHGPDGASISGHQLELVFRDGLLPVPLENAVSLGVFALSKEGQVGDVALSRGMRHVRPPQVLSPNKEAVDPSCRVESVQGNPLEQMPRAGRLVVRAEGLSPNLPLEVRANGRLVNDLQDVRSDKGGFATFTLRGEEIPLEFGGKSNMPVVLAVGAGGATAICGFQFFEKVTDLENFECLDGPEFASVDKVPLNGYGDCYYDYACEPGRFEYAVPAGDRCPDGSPPRIVNGETFFNGNPVLEPACLVPVNAFGMPNCFNSVFNLPPGANPEVPGMGLAYNFTVWSSEGEACVAYPMSDYGLDINLDEEVRELCLSDKDGDGIPLVHDQCPDDYGYNYLDYLGTNPFGDEATLVGVQGCPVGSAL